MASNFVQVPPQSTGLKIDTSEVVVGANTVERENVVLGDPVTGANLANVTGAGALKVDGSAVTQPVSLSGNVTVIQPTGANLHADIDNFPATQPVSGTVSVTSFANPLPVSQSGTWTNTVTQATAANLNATVVQASGAALHVDVDNFPATQPVSGTVSVSNFANPLPVSQSGSWTVVANQGSANAAPWNENVAQFGGNAVITGTGVSGVGIPRVTVSSDSFPTTQVVSGTVTVGNPGVNFSLESGGNLASAAATLIFQNQLIDLLAQILVQQKYTNLLLASNSNLGDDLDVVSSGLIQ